MRDTLRVLVFAAHPDDEVLGCGGTIVRHGQEGDEVYLCVVTQAYAPEWSRELQEKKRQEVFKASEVLGIKKVFFCGLPTVKLNTVPQIELNRAIQEVLDAVQPQVVYCPPRGDINRDHHLVFEGILVACRPVPGGQVRRLLCYEVPPTTRYTGPFAENLFMPNVYVDISFTLDKKLEALVQYETELKEFPHPRSLEGLRLYARERGISVGLEAAEAFFLVREVWSGKAGGGGLP